MFRKETMDSLSLFLFAFLLFKIELLPFNMESDRAEYSNRNEKPLDQFDGIDSEPEKMRECNIILWFGIISFVIPGLIGIILGIQAITTGNNALRKHEENPFQFTSSSIDAVKWGRGLGIAGFILRAVLIVFLILVTVLNS